MPPPAPLFIFGDFNFRLEGKSVVRKLTGDKMKAPDAAEVAAAAAASVSRKNCDAAAKATNDIRFFRDDDSKEVVLSIGKKEFNLRQEDHAFYSAGFIFVHHFAI